MSKPQLYTIPDLVWEEEGRCWRARPPLAISWRYGVFKNLVSAWFVVGGLFSPRDRPCDSIEHGKQLANEHWKRSMAAVLTPWEENDDA